MTKRGRYCIIIPVKSRARGAIWKIISFIFYGGENMKYVCDLCGYIYDEAAGDPDNGIAPGTKWDDLPDDFVCPLCGVGKDQFSPAE